LDWLNGVDPKAACTVEVGRSGGIGKHPDASHVVVAHPKLHHGEELTADAAPTPLAAHSNLVEHELTLVAATPMLDVTQEVADHPIVNFGDPMDDFVAPQISGGFHLRERRVGASAGLILEVGVIFREQANDRFVARLESTN